MSNKEAGAKLIETAKEYRDFFKSRVQLIDDGKMQTKAREDEGPYRDTTAGDRAFFVKKIAEFEEIIEDHGGSSA